MRKIWLVLALVSGSSLLGPAFIPAQNAIAEQPPAVKLDLSETIRKSLTKRRLRYSRPIRATGYVVANLKADLVAVKFGLKAEGDNAGSAITALSKKKDDLTRSASKLGFTTANTTTVSLNVRERSVRSYSSDGNRINKKVFKGTMSVLLTFKIGDDLLSDIAKIAGSKVSSVGRMQFSFSDEEWAKQTAGLKKSAIEKARTIAQEKADRQGRKLTSIARSDVNAPRRRGRNFQRMVQTQVTARMSFNVE